MKIGQISFLRMTTPADVPYGQGALGSKYQGQRGPTPEPLLGELRRRTDQSPWRASSSRRWRARSSSGAAEHVGDLRQRARRCGTGGRGTRRRRTGTRTSGSSGWRRTARPARCSRAVSSWLRMRVEHLEAGADAAGVEVEHDAAGQLGGDAAGGLVGDWWRRWRGSPWRRPCGRASRRRPGRRSRRGPTARRPALVPSHCSSFRRPSTIGQSSSVVQLRRRPARRPPRAPRARASRCRPPAPSPRRPRPSRRRPA